MKLDTWVNLNTLNEFSYKHEISKPLFDFFLTVTNVTDQCVILQLIVTCSLGCEMRNGQAYCMLVL